MQNRLHGAGRTVQHEGDGAQVRDRRHGRRPRADPGRREGTHPDLQRRGDRPLGREDPRDVRGPADRPGRGRRAEVPGPFAPDRRHRREAVGQGPPRQALLPPRALGQGRPPQGAVPRRQARPPPRPRPPRPSARRRRSPPRRPRPMPRRPPKPTRRRSEPGRIPITRACPCTTRSSSFPDSPGRAPRS